MNFGSFSLRFHPLLCILNLDVNCGNLSYSSLTFTMSVQPLGVCRFRSKRYRPPANSVYFASANYFADGSTATIHLYDVFDVYYHTDVTRQFPEPVL